MTRTVSSAVKRRPTLADLALAQSPLQPTGIRASWRAQSLDWLRLAKRFVFDESAASFLGRMVYESPRVIADAQDFAIPSYQNMWVELPFPPFLDGLGNPNVSGPDDDRADIRVGYLFNGPAVRVFFESRGGDVGMLPLQYALHQPMTLEAQLAVADALHISRLGLDLWFWGSSARAYMGALCTNDEERFAAEHEWDRAGLRALRANHSVSLAPLLSTGVGADLPNLGRELASGSSGDLRNIIAILLFMNRTADITITADVPRVEGFISNKLRPFLSHRVITLKLDPMPRLRRLSAGLGIKRRLHDVRGHFCHDRTAREGCPHGEEHGGDFGEWWEEYDVLRWCCTRCGGKRWWRHEHKRGEQKLGAVVQRYEVTR